MVLANYNIKRIFSHSFLNNNNNHQLVVYITLYYFLFTRICVLFVSVQSTENETHKNYLIVYYYEGLVCETDDAFHSIPLKIQFIQCFVLTHRFFVFILCVNACRRSSIRIECEEKKKCHLIDVKVNPWLNFRFSFFFFFYRRFNNNDELLGELRWRLCS